MHSTKNIKISHYISTVCCRRDISDRCVFNYCNWSGNKRGPSVLGWGVLSAHGV